MVAKAKTVGYLLQVSADFLKDRGVDNPRLACEHLLARLLRCKRLDLYLRTDMELDEPRLAAMRRGIRRLAAGEPVQYILGQWEFLGRVFKTDPRALIPRPETEELTRLALSCEALWQMPQRCVADVGTGSGCIAVSLALARPDFSVVALDTSEAALELARENATALSVADRIAFVHAELCDAVEPESLAGIVTNPPYIPTAEVETLPRHIGEHEPRTALDGGPDGMDVIRVIVQDAAVALAPGGFLFMEIGATQDRAVAALCESVGFDDVAVLPDLSGRQRVVRGRLASS
jgi:release factor glutamine methyltransferase